MRNLKADLHRLMVLEELSTEAGRSRIETVETFTPASWSLKNYRLRRQRRHLCYLKAVAASWSLKNYRLRLVRDHCHFRGSLSRLMVLEELSTEAPDFSRWAFVLHRLMVLEELSTEAHGVVFAALGTRNPPPGP